MKNKNGNEKKKKKNFFSKKSKIKNQKQTKNK